MGKAMMQDRRFGLGQVVITRGALAKCDADAINYFKLVARHERGDFGSVGHLDTYYSSLESSRSKTLAADDGLVQNALAIEAQRGMVLSTYEVGEPRPVTIWVITMLAGNDTYTTVLLPEEY
ncbi:MAG: hypothetical protein KQH59_12945 [Desulfobulbaceae bacterium]|nr:hypothetical protein [Desulfobulbaceae bacterium]